ncbi:MAG: zinc-dependent metalloprotease, partial [Flavobacteriaceae bacterium]
NFAASAKNRASVMDYPHPTLSLENDQISYANAYDTGIGDWDKISVAYSYSDFPQGVDENQALTNLLENSARDGFRFISDSDARPLGGAHPIAHLWDNGANPTTELELLMRIRKKALNNLSLAHLRTNETYTQLEDRMVPLYLLHRYQVEAVVKLIGGVDYDYAVKGGISYTTKAVPAQQQKQAVQALINTLQPDALMLPQSLLEILPPRAFGSPRSRESFQSQTGVTFDPFALAHTTSHAILGMMFHPERATRLQQQAYLEGRQWSLAATIDQLTTTFFMDNSKKGYAAGLQEVVQANLIEHLMQLGQMAEVPSSVRATVFDKLSNLKTSLSKNKQLAQAPYFAQRINQYLSNYELHESPEVPKIPDGSPIGSIACDFETVWK